MFAELAGQPSLDDLPDRLLERLTRRLMDDVKDPLDLFSDRVGERPSGQLLGDGIEIVHATPRVSGNHAVADAREGNLEPLMPGDTRVPCQSSFRVARRVRQAHDPRLTGLRAGLAGGDTVETDGLVSVRREGRCTEVGRRFSGAFSHSSSTFWCAAQRRRSSLGPRRCSRGGNEPARPWERPPRTRWCNRWCKPFG